MPSSTVRLARSAITRAGRERIVFVRSAPRRDARYTVSLECDRHTGETQIVGADSEAASLLVFPVPGQHTGDGFRHPFRYAP
jgi:hypothetical protein